MSFEYRDHDDYEPEDDYHRGGASIITFAALMVCGACFWAGAMVYKWWFCLGCGS